MSAIGPMVNDDFGRWRCQNRACPNHNLTGMEVKRLVEMQTADGSPVFVAAAIKCGRCKVVTGVAA